VLLIVEVQNTADAEKRLSISKYSIQTS